MKAAYLFPGQGVQFPGMGKALYHRSPHARALFEQANTLLGFRITDLMFNATQAVLQDTAVAQPAIFLQSIITAKTAPHFVPTMVAGHSLGEITALVASRVITFEAGLQLVSRRANAMQAACLQTPGTMAAVLGLADTAVEQICATVQETVMPTNYNCPGQLVIAGTLAGMQQACRALKAAGAKIQPLAVSGAFHTPLMQSASTILAQTIEQTLFQKGTCPIYQNVDAQPTMSPEVMQKKLLQQLTSPVQWAKTIQNMISNGVQHFIICGPKQPLQGLIKRIDPVVTVGSL